MTGGFYPAKQSPGTQISQNTTQKSAHKKKYNSDKIGKYCRKSI